MKDLNILQIVTFLLTLFQKLEDAGLIKIDHTKIDLLMKLALSELKGVQRPDDGSPNNPGLGPLNKPS